MVEQRTQATQKAKPEDTRVQVFPHRDGRARAWDPPIPWRHVDVKEATKAFPEITTSAVFVVHGMGTQAHLDTQVTLRDGFEDQVERLARGKDPIPAVPPPFISEGYWADYADLEATFPREWSTFAPRERNFFSRVWRKRLEGFRTYVWLVRQAFRLVFDRHVYRKMPGSVPTKVRRWFVYLGILVMTLTLGTFFYARFRGVANEVLGDVRMYADPHGVVERAIVQRIDRRVGDRFLQLLGVAPDLTDLADGECIQASGQPVRFDRVTWLAHSLGSVVSYNVISDLFERCRALERELAAPGRVLTPEDQQRLANVTRVKDGLHRFVTIGSPLEKFALLFPDALRPWPRAWVEQEFCKGRRWWTNVYHLWDPVSGRLRDPERFPQDDPSLAARPAKERKHAAPDLPNGVDNVHPNLWRVPVVAHVAYWKDPGVLQYVLSRAYGSRAYPLPEADFLSRPKVEVARAVTVPLISIMMVGVVVGAVGLLAWTVANPGDAARAVWGLLAAWAG